MPRPINPETAYRFVAHVTHGHAYASVQCLATGKDGKRVRRHHHYGVLEGNRFVPWAEFLALPAVERSKFIFPKEWDLSLLGQLSGVGEASYGGVRDGESQERLYGDVWLLGQLGEQTGIRRDLEAVFEGDCEVVDAIMTLALFGLLTGFELERVSRWQRIVKAPCDRPLTSEVIAGLMAAITENHCRDLLSLWGARGEGVDCEAAAPGGAPGRRMVWFVARVLRTAGERVWKERLRETYGSLEDVLDEMRCIHCIERVGRPLEVTPLNEPQRAICAAFGVEAP